ncbi:AAA family ATPase [Shewanella xiamenensis]|uniref:AAA family ATPase n=1 Tax=Shewanella xiamenensis TaxID=332186 RepID=UPI00313F1902
MTKIKAKLTLLLEQLNHGLVDREATMKSALLSILAGENILLIGPPGTAKSLVARRISKIFNENNLADTTTYFEYLLTKFSTPEEIFGPLSIKALKDDCFQRNTVGYLPSAKIAFLDEVFKASSSILNALLTIMNERIYHNGTKAEDVPLRALIAASNELPIGQEELSALYDRFLVRSFVDYISANKLLHLFDLSEEVEIQDPLTQEDLNWLDDTIKNITISAEIRKAILEIWEKHKDAFKEDRREVLSDRRFTKVIKLLRVSAATNDRSEVDLSDVLLLKDCLWNHPDNALRMREIVLTTLRKYSHEITVEPNVQNLTISTKVEPVLQPSNKNVVKGYKGSGTESDPLLISNTDELFGLNRQDVGMMGFYFRQTQDIDCSTLGVCSPISFIGHYDGNFFSIIGSGCNKTIFSEINPQSYVSNLRLINVSLTNNASGSSILNCKADGRIVTELAYECIIHDCITNDSLSGDAESCTIERCQTNAPLISKEGYTYAKNCKIADCLIYINNDQDFGIARNIENNSIITRCLVSGKTSSYNFYGFSSTLIDSEICNSALGPVKSQYEIRSAITNENYKFTLKNNASIGSLTINDRKDNPNGVDGKKVADAQFNQYYFEHTLSWDFENIWKWNNKTNLPCLRKGKFEKIKVTLDGNESPTIELLTLQINSNIWL